MVKKIRSGAQTGADQGGLKAGIILGLATGGWMPLGRRTESGRLDSELFKLWRLQEHPSWAYPGRTEKNVAESDGTVIFGNLNSPGSLLTIRFCKKWNKHFIGNPSSPEALAKWCEEHGIEDLNVAGNRESTNPGIDQRTCDFLVRAFKR